MSGESYSAGGGGIKDFFLFTISEDFESCGNMVVNDIALPVIDVSSP